MSRPSPQGSQSRGPTQTPSEGEETLSSIAALNSGRALESGCVLKTG
jgi:hypothetical protein